MIINDTFLVSKSSQDHFVLISMGNYCKKISITTNLGSVSRYNYRRTLEPCHGVAIPRAT